MSATLRMNFLIERVAMTSALIDALSEQREADTDELFRIALAAHEQQDQHDRSVTDTARRARARPAR